MALKMRPTGLGHGVYKDDADYGVFCGEWCIGRIYQTRTGPESLRWFWALHAPSKPGEMRTSNQVATLDEAKAEFEASWKQWKAWAKLEEVPSLGYDYLNAHPLPLLWLKSPLEGAGPAQGRSGQAHPISFQSQQRNISRPG